jgi:hypothetical protein
MENAGAPGRRKFEPLVPDIRRVERGFRFGGAVNAKPVNAIEPVAPDRTVTETPEALSPVVKPSIATVRKSEFKRNSDRIQTEIYNSHGHLMLPPNFAFCGVILTAP